ncbi:VOC family protein [Cellulomonas marina]|uniref:Glyoxalase-like domain-containing protein n=1 Tax=Cellulomonas marina TaxID=988821 RepID=A0A1I0WUC3_9CELL|nr:VOC family protein [Cellulomonas marina]GIG30356.1 hypothetical protein Cma02nite_29560 [Cellulomonas marina]SFA92359.1 hypothetical protein SAMN05421867_103252 [Cellulomonas marina]
MALRWYTTVVEAQDHRALADFWRQVLGWEVMFEDDTQSVVIPPWAMELTEQLPFERVPPGLVFVPVEHAKAGKNRLHLDLAPHTSDDRDVEIARLLALGARRVDVGQGDVPWEVLADPEGNEFCVLSARE